MMSGGCDIGALTFPVLFQNFRKGLGSYLKKFAYKNARTGTDLLPSSKQQITLPPSPSPSPSPPPSLPPSLPPSPSLPPEDLWASLEEASQKPVATVMSTWTKQMGYPVLTVEGKQVLH